MLILKFELLPIEEKMIHILIVSILAFLILMVFGLVLGALMNIFRQR